MVSMDGIFRWVGRLVGWYYTSKRTNMYMYICTKITKYTRVATFSLRSGQTYISMVSFLNKTAKTTCNTHIYIYIEIHIYIYNKYT